MSRINGRKYLHACELRRGSKARPVLAPIACAVDQGAIGGYQPSIARTRKRHRRKGLPRVASRKPIWEPGRAAIRCGVRNRFASAQDEIARPVSEEHRKRRGEPSASRSAPRDRERLHTPCPAPIVRDIEEGAASRATPGRPSCGRVDKRHTSLVAAKRQASGRLLDAADGLLNFGPVRSPVYRLVNRASFTSCRYPVGKEEPAVRRIDEVNVTRPHCGRVRQDELGPGCSSVRCVVDRARSSGCRRVSSSDPGAGFADELRAGSESGHAGRSDVDPMSPSIRRAQDTLFGQGPTRLGREHMDRVKVGCRGSRR
jgi:hypothetical protein